LDCGSPLPLSLWSVTYVLTHAPRPQACIHHPNHSIPLALGCLVLLWVLVLGAWCFQHVLLAPAR